MASSLVERMRSRASKSRTEVIGGQAAARPAAHAGDGLEARGRTGHGTVPDTQLGLAPAMGRVLRRRGLPAAEAAHPATTLADRMRQRFAPRAVRA